MNQSIIKIILSILFLICLIHMTYGYYQVIRFLGTLGFVLLAYINYQQNKNIAAVIFLALALLFQPFLKVALGRTIWNIVDILVSIGLLTTLIASKKKSSD